ncbi:hypothetical protein DXK91_12365 [Parageobacillus toebii]|nr:hypothetical protein DCC82_12905 [Geobacillus sp. LYN3]RDV21854.1 hypothetical protein DXK91_12365 [Parageobacillus toebii]
MSIIASNSFIFTNILFIFFINIRILFVFCCLITLKSSVIFLFFYCSFPFFNGSIIVKLES